MIKPQYEASAKLFIGKDETTPKVKSYDNNNVIMYQMERELEIAVIGVIPNIYED